MRGEKRKQAADQQDQADGAEVKKGRIRERERAVKGRARPRHVVATLGCQTALNNGQCGKTA